MDREKGGIIQLLEETDRLKLLEEGFAEEILRSCHQSKGFREDSEAWCRQ